MTTACETSEIAVLHLQAPLSLQVPQVQVPLSRELSTPCPRASKNACVCLFDRMNSSLRNSSCILPEVVSPLDGKRVVYHRIEKSHFRDMFLSRSLKITITMDVTMVTSEGQVLMTRQMNLTMRS
jgi:hypothetical protein